MWNYEPTLRSLLGPRYLHEWLSAHSLFISIFLSKWVFVPIFIVYPLWILFERFLVSLINLKRWIIIIFILLLLIIFLICILSELYILLFTGLVISVLWLWPASRSWIRKILLWVSKIVPFICIVLLLILAIILSIKIIPLILLVLSIIHLSFLISTSLLGFPRILILLLSWML